jgi:hypothetical protein
MRFNELAYEKKLGMDEMSYYPDSPFIVICQYCNKEIGIDPTWESMGCPFCGKLIGETEGRITNNKFKTRW